MSWLPITHWTAEWKLPGVIRADLMAGFTGAVVVLPQGLAFATLAGMPPYYGLYAAMIPCVLAAFFGSSRLMVTGPANAISLTTMALMAPLAIPGSASYVSFVLTLSFLVGVIQLALGLGGAGRWVEKVPHSVVVGFTVGAAVLIINTQLGTLLGLDIPRGTPVLDTLDRAYQGLISGEVIWWSPLVVASTLLVMRLWRPLNQKIPAMLIGLTIGSMVAAVIEALAGTAVSFRRVDGIPGAVPPLSLPDLGLGTLQQLFGPALVMVLLASTEAMAIARAMALRHGDRFDANQEFVGQGLANVGGAFFSAYPSSGSFNRSGVNAAAGARTPLAAASAGAFLPLIILFVAPLATHLPYVVIAALLLTVAWGLIDLRQIKHELQAGPRESIPMVVTMIGTVLVSLEWAILVGICTALVCARFFHKPPSN